MDCEKRAGERRVLSGRDFVDYQREVMGDLKSGNADSAFDKYNKLVENFDFDLEYLVSDSVFSALMRSVDEADEHLNERLRQIIVDQARFELSKYGFKCGTGSERELYFVHPNLNEETRSSTSEELQGIASIIGNAIYLDNLIRGNIEFGEAIIHNFPNCVYLFTDGGHDRALNYFNAFIPDNSQGLVLRFDAEDLDDPLSVDIVNQIATEPETRGFFDNGQNIPEMFEGLDINYLPGYLPTTNVDASLDIVSQKSFEDIEKSMPSLMQSFIEQQGFGDLKISHIRKALGYIFKENYYYFGEGNIRHEVCRNPHVSRLDVVRKSLGIKSDYEITGELSEGLTIVLDGDFPDRESLEDITSANTHGGDSLLHVGQGVYFISILRGQNDKTQIGFQGKGIKDLAVSLGTTDVDCTYADVDESRNCAENIIFENVYEGQIDKILKTLFTYVKDQAQYMPQED